MARELLRRVVGARENKLQVAVVFCDLSKAFDVANHDVLATKMNYYGISGPSLALLTNSMRQRSQVVVGEGGSIRSDPLTTTMGVAQGSSLSNIMFSLLLNDLPQSIDTAHMLMYADDVAGVVVAPNIEQLEQRLNETATKLAQWFGMNGMVLNISKTQFIHFNLAGQPPKAISVRAGDAVVEQTKAATFLGFILDRGLTWDAHIDKVCGKLGSACFALNHLARTVPAEVVRTCYFATVHSLLQYGAELWGRAADWERAFRMQKRAIRAIARVSQDTSARPYFKSLGIMTLPSIVIYQVAMYVRDNYDSYQTHGDVHHRNTRRANKLMALGRGLAKSGKLTHVMGPAVYNKLPIAITEAPSHDRFKSALKRWLVEQAFYRFDEFID